MKYTKQAQTIDPNLTGMQLQRQTEALRAARRAMQPATQPGMLNSILERVRRAGSDINTGAIGDKVRNVGANISGWYGGLDPQVQKSLKTGLISAGIGGLMTGGLAAMRPRDPDEDTGGSIMGPALLGALLTGTAGAALPYGLSVLKGDAPPPPPPPPTGIIDKAKHEVGNAADAAGAAGLKHWGPTAGAGLGLHGIAKSWLAGDLHKGKYGQGLGAFAGGTEDLLRNILNDPKARIPGLRINRAQETVRGFNFDEITRHLDRPGSYLGRNAHKLIPLVNKLNSIKPGAGNALLRRWVSMSRSMQLGRPLRQAAAYLGAKDIHGNYVRPVQHGAAMVGRAALKAPGAVAKAVPDFLLRTWNKSTPKGKGALAALPIMMGLGYMGQKGFEGRDFLK